MNLDEAIKTAFNEVKHRLPELTGIDSEPTINVGGGCANIWQKRGEDMVEIAHFCMSKMPGCRPVLICNQVGVVEEFRHHGIGSLLQEVRLRAAALAQIQVLLCTVLETNMFQRRIMDKYGWKPLTNFTNPFTGNRVILFFREINNAT